MQAVYKNFELGMLAAKNEDALYGLRLPGLRGGGVRRKWCRGA